MDAAGNSVDLDWQRIADKRRAVFLQAFDGELQRDPCARNRRGAGAAIGLDDVAVERDLTFAKRLEIDDRAQAAADQPLDFLRPSRLLALGRFAAAAGVGGDRKSTRLNSSH